MKKPLSVLLAFAIAANCALCAVANGDPPDPNMVTGIDAVWNGDILLHPNSLGPIAMFMPNNVAITLQFADGKSELLTGWDTISYHLPDRRYESYDWPFRLFHQFEFDATGTKCTAVIYYESKEFLDAYIEANSMPPKCIDHPEHCECEWWDYWAQYRSALPKASFPFPVDYLDQYISAREPLQQLKLDEKVTVKPEPWLPVVFTFTPEKSGDYDFFREGPSQFSSGFVLLSADGDWGSITSANPLSSCSLIEGKTYQLFVHAEGGAEISVSVSDCSKQNEQSSLLQRILHFIIYYLLFGWLWI